MLTCLMKGIYCMSTCQMFGERSSLLGTLYLGVEVEQSVRMREIGVRSPVGTHLSQ